MSEFYYEFREPQSIEELEEALFMRYRTYKNAGFESFLNKNGAEIDIDTFDKFSIPFLILRNEGREKEVVGHMRSVFEKETKYSPQISQLAEKHGIPELAQIEYSHSLPTMNLDSDVSKAIEEFQSTEKKEGRVLVEVGRFMIDEKDRGGRLSFIFMEMLIAYFPKNYQLFNSCRIEHKEGYRLVGGEIFPKTTAFPTFEWMTNVLLFNREKFAKFILDREDRLRAAFLEHEHLIFMPEKPNTFFYRDKISNEIKSI